MNSTGSVLLGPALAVVLVVLAGLAALVVRFSGVGRWRDVLTAAVRAVLQLAAVSAVIGLVLRSIWATAGFLLLMTAVAAGTSARRITGSVRGRGWWTALPIAVAVLPTLSLILASGALPLSPVALLPSAGILIGGAMTATSLAGRRLTEELHDRRGEYEAALSIGLVRRDAVRLVGRPAAALALVPGLDQTRTVGLVTLPGAFVGVLLAGASAWQAGATQLLVLFGLLLVQSTAVLVTVELVAAGLLPPGGTVLPS
ncbi:ABC transporter permease [Nakamurella sp. YIM 132087]|uniref:ABC transporter permease n=1 Tax=Nakamurella alba TaxID=2665158 RepID=A0A7K1FHB8_9ACTN|nr:ABC transporter permease [Nakamurella alba]MTD13515.1 ABC transporter permease [Nakamurella alba]